MFKVGGRVQVGSVVFRRQDFTGEECIVAADLRVRLSILNSRNRNLLGRGDESCCVSEVNYYKSRILLGRSSALRKQKDCEGQYVTDNKGLDLHRSLHPAWLLSS